MQLIECRPRFNECKSTYLCVTSTVGTQEGQISEDVVTQALSGPSLGANTRHRARTLRCLCAHVSNILFTSNSTVGRDTSV